MSSINVLRWEVREELRATIDQIAAAPLRALLLKASGPHFSAGADVPAMFEGLSAHAAEAQLAKQVPLMERLQYLPIPTIAAVQGIGLTAGLDLFLPSLLLWSTS